MLGIWDAVIKGQREVNGGERGESGRERMRGKHAPCRVIEGLGEEAGSFRGRGEGQRGRGGGGEGGVREEVWAKGGEKKYGRQGGKECEQVCRK